MDPLPPVTPRCDGLYVAQWPEQDSFSYLRFYPDCWVTHVSSVGTPEQVARWIGRKRRDLGQGRYVMAGYEILFCLVSPRGRVDYTGVVPPDAALIELNSHSLINQHRGTAVHDFVPIAGFGVP
ncbi:hypothetical protein Drose_22700 [Dactylosporangium roseum]|uniref:Uncharacterized protein n=1 Tax=Dactylosporangium roseum TaxID=47989 RepID=A0ABY5YZJ9_9ACTN|nr:hypothetical protein [Dactylosporangium roseum]UWZ34062.1 hypothetical protein Drose_22700 [Dactylosporangium roseum]